MQKLLSLIRSNTGRALSGSFATSLLAKFAQIAMSILAARLLQPAGFGIFTFSLGVGLLGGRLGGLGWPVLMNRLVPKYRVDENWSDLRGLVRAAHMTVIAGAVLCSLLCAGIALWVGPEDRLYSGLLLGAFLIPIMAFRSLYRNLLAALRIPQKGIMVDELLPAAFMVLALVFLMQTTLNTQTAVVWYLAASGTAVLTGAFWIWKNLPIELGTVLPDYSKFRLWMGIALPALIGMSARLLMNKTDVLMLAPLGTMEDVGYYSAALRATYVQTAAVVVLSTVVTARISEAFAAGREKQGKRLFFGALAFALACSVPLAIPLIFWDNWIMTTFFGDSYELGAPVLQILAISQIGAAVIIPASSLMLMTGRQARFGQMTTGALVANICLNIVLIPKMGATGAALATCISILSLATFQLMACALIIRSRQYEEVKKTK